jgi:hypothetical protein
MTGGISGLLDQGIAPSGLSGLISASFLIVISVVLLRFGLMEARAEGSFSATTVSAGITTFGLGALAVAGDMSIASAAGAATVTILASREFLIRYLQELMTVAQAPAGTSFNKDHPFPSRVVDNKLLSGPGSIKETRHFVISIAGSGLKYKPGDSLGIYPTNSAADVEALLSRLRADGSERIELPLIDEIQDINSSFLIFSTCLFLRVVGKSIGRLERLN